MRTFPRLCLYLAAVTTGAILAAFWLVQVYDKTPVCDCVIATALWLIFLTSEKCFA